MTTVANITVGMMTSGLKRPRSSRRLKLTGGSAYATIRDLDLGPFPERFPVGGNSSGGYLAGIKAGDRPIRVSGVAKSSGVLPRSQMLTSQKDRVYLTI